MDADIQAIEQFYRALKRIREHAIELGSYGAYSELAAVVEDQAADLSLENSPTLHFLNSFTKSILDCNQELLLNRIDTLERLLEETKSTLEKHNK